MCNFFKGWEGSIFCKIFLTSTFLGMGWGDISGDSPICSKSRKIILFLVILIGSASTLVIKVAVVQELAFDFLGVLWFWRF